MSRELETVKRAILSADLYGVLMDVQNGITSPGLASMANSAIRRIDAAREAFAALSDAAPEGEKAEGEVASFVVRHHDGEVLEHTVTLRADFEEACNYLPEGTVVRLYAEPVPSGVIEKAVQDMAAFARRLAPSTPPADAGCVAALQAWVAEQLSSAESHWIDTLQERWEDGDDVPDREHFVSLWIAERLPAAPAAQAKEA